MTEYKILGQSANDGNEENLYSVPATKSAVVRAINVTNTSSTSDTFDIAINDSAIVPVATPTYVAVAYNNQTAASSTDGITWTQRTLPGSFSWYSVTYGDGTFVAMARSSPEATAASTDGITWTQGTLPVFAYWQSVTYGDGTFVAVAMNSTAAATSTDGSTWIQRT